MTLEATKDVGPAGSLERYGEYSDQYRDTPTNLIQDMVRTRPKSKWATHVSALLAVLAYSKAGYDAVRVGFSDGFDAAAHAFLNFGFSRVIFRNSTNTAYVPIQAESVYLTGSNITVSAGTGTPESSVTAPVGSLYLRTDGGASSTLYVKESGAGNTGWVAK